MSINHNKIRPIYINLFQIRLPVSAISSITHRLAGIYIFFVTLPLSLYLLYFSTNSYNDFMILKNNLSNSFYLSTFVAFSFLVYAYHILTGVRHLLQDLHIENLSLLQSIILFRFLFMVFAGLVCFHEIVPMIRSTLFYAQRFSAVYLLAYTFWLAIFFVSNNPLEYYTWSVFTKQLDFLVLTSIAAFVSIIHAFIGLWTIGTDYFTSRTLGFISMRFAKYADIIRGTYTIFFSLLGLSIITIILHTIWS